MESGHEGTSRQNQAFLEHLKLWVIRYRSSSKIHALSAQEYAAADLQIQPHADTIYGDPEYTCAEYVQS